MNRTPSRLLLLALLATIAACLPSAYQAPTAQSMVANAHEHTDAQLLQRLEATRARVRAAPVGSLNETYAMAGEVRMAWELGTVGRGKVDGQALLAEANALIDAALNAHPESRAQLLTRKGYMLMAAKADDQAIAAFQGVLEVQKDVSTWQALIELADRKGQPAEVVALCKTARPHATDEDSRYFLLKKCHQHSHAATVEEGLAWAGKDDIAFYHSKLEQLEGRQQRHNEQLAREAKRNADAFAQSSQCQSTCKRDYKRCMTFCPAGPGAPCGRTCADVEQECRMACYRENSERRSQDAQQNAAERAR